MAKVEAWDLATAGPVFQARKNIRCNNPEANAL